MKIALTALAYYPHFWAKIDYFTHKEPVSSIYMYYGQKYFGWETFSMIGLIEISLKKMDREMPKYLHLR